MRYYNIKINERGKSLEISKAKDGSYNTNLFGNITNTSNKFELAEIINSYNKHIKRHDLNGGIFDLDILNRLINDLKDKNGFELLRFEEQPKLNPNNKTIGSSPNSKKSQPKAQPKEEPQPEEKETAQAETQQQEEEIKEDNQLQLKIETLNSLKNFFEEFKTPAVNSNRFINTLRQHVNNKFDAINYTKNYFAIQDFPQSELIALKLESPEFESILLDLAKINTTKKINNRLKIYFGPAGTGKTTQAINENPDAAVVVCNGSMEPSDLFEEFSFNDGKPEFKKSAFVEAMEEGKPIILDEINLLNMQCLRALQTITDNKGSFSYKNKNINIKDGFKIIGTMNLSVNGRVYSLPEPLVDRCEEIKEFTLTSEQLAERCF